MDTRRHKIQEASIAVSSLRRGHGVGGAKVRILAPVEPAGEPTFSGGSLCGKCFPDDAKRCHVPALATASHGRLAASEGEALEAG